VAQAQAHVIEGHRFVVDIDLAKFFDRVNHDRLMATVAARVADRRLLRLIRSFLAAGVLDNGLFETSEEGTPQGGPFSPLLSNLVLDELDRELERRGHRFVRYADDCNIYVRSEKAGRRVMKSVTRFIERRLKLQVNAAKSAVDRPWRRSFLSFNAAERTGAAPVHRRQGRHPVQTPGARADGAASGRQPGADDPRAGSIPSGMGRLLRLQPVAGAAVARRLGPTTPALRRLGPVEDARQAIPGTAPPKRPRTADERSHLQPQGSLADQLLRSPAQGLHQSSLPSSGFANHEARECLIRRTAVYGPVRTAVWEGRSREAPPYPD
jgi:Reverse transcriptase (RNA-dependent DNA polymerase)